MNDFLVPAPHFLPSGLISDSALSWICGAILHFSLPAPHFLPPGLLSDSAPSWICGAILLFLLPRRIIFLQDCSLTLPCPGFAAPSYIFLFRRRIFFPQDCSLTLPCPGFAALSCIFLLPRRRSSLTASLRSQKRIRTAIRPPWSASVLYFFKVQDLESESLPLFLDQQGFSCHLRRLLHAHQFNQSRHDIAESSALF